MPVVNSRDHFERIYGFSNFVELRETVVGGLLFDYPPTPVPAENDDEDDEQEEQSNVLGRSLLWKLALLPPPPLASPASPRETLDYQLAYLRQQRQEFANHARNVPVLGTGLPAQATEHVNDDLDTNNPLSLSTNNPWNTYYTSLPLLHTLQQDITRTFPSISYFRTPKVQADLTQIMFLYVTYNEEGKKTGYRQGMHELAACLYWAIDFDATASSSNPTIDEELCSKDHVASDTLALLTIILTAPAFSLSRWYEHSPPSPSTYAPFKPPIARACEELLYRLRRIDPLLAGKLDRESIEGGIFGIRALRLLFTRDFPLVDALRLWDGLFVVASPLFNISETSRSNTPSMLADPSDQGENQNNLRDLAIWLGVAMLVRIRNLMIPADYTTLLGHLIRYPGGIAYCSSKPVDPPLGDGRMGKAQDVGAYPPRSPPAASSPLDTNDPDATPPSSSIQTQFPRPSRFRGVHHTAYLLQQSISLFRTASQQLGPLSGAGLIRGNWEVLGIHPRVTETRSPASPKSPALESRSEGKARARVSPNDLGRRPGIGKHQSPYATVSAASLQDLIMRGVSVASEKIEQAAQGGTGATAWGVFDEIRRNLPDLPALASTPTSATPTGLKSLQPDPFDTQKRIRSSSTLSLPVLKSPELEQRDPIPAVLENATLSIWDTGQSGPPPPPRPQVKHTKGESISSGPGRPPWEPKTRFEVERELNELQTTMVELSKGVGRVLDVLLSTSTSTASTSKGAAVEAAYHPSTKEGQEQQREALESLDYIREVLANGGRGSGSGEIDRERLFGETWVRQEKIAKERKEREQQEAERLERKKALDAIPPLPPPLKHAAVGETSRLPVLGKKEPRSLIGPAPQPRPKSRDSPAATTAVTDSPLLPATKPRLVAAPWEHTPSKFSGPVDGLPASGIALPPPVRRVSNSIATRKSTPTPPPDPAPRRDPLGVLP